MSDSKTNVYTRREILIGAAGTFLLLRMGEGEARAAGYEIKDHRWAYLVDLTKCIGCGACVRACRSENKVPEGFFRTWVERYTFLRDGKVLVDSPDGAQNGFAADPQVDKASIEKSFFVPKLCNHCSDSPCVQVCPVGASYRTDDGVVLVDRNHCVGCGYCVQACPYGCRFISPVGGFADKCTLCYHRITKGQTTACVQACPVGARLVGDLKSPGGEFKRILDSSRHGVLKPELGTHPNAYYIGFVAQAPSAATQGFMSVQVSI